MLHCSNIRDRDNLVDQETAALNGALFVMTPWFPQASVQAFKLKEACLWVRVEGLPLTAATPAFVRPMLKEIRRVLYFDEESMGPGIKEFLRVKVRVPLELSKF
uniref:DUF4283 domain-containing protein n=1 Tax=Chenopodium quinoa TaxID=63459 RepID=A0A803KUL9_CHEQI